MKNKSSEYISLIFLFVPAVLFVSLAFYFKKDIIFDGYKLWGFPIHFYFIGFFGLIASSGGILDWNFHRKVLKMKISENERKAEAKALGLGGIPMFICMFWAMISPKPNLFLIPIFCILIFTTSSICYDELVFHRVRCGPKENTYHRMLVWGNAIAWLIWIHLIYYR